MNIFLHHDMDIYTFDSNDTQTGKKGHYLYRKPVSESSLKPTDY